MKNQFHKSFRNFVLGHYSYISLALALTLALLSCSRLGAAQTVNQAPAVRRNNQARAGNIKYDAVHALAMQPDGKVIVAGRTCLGNSIRDGMTSRDLQCNFALARYLADGTLDASFGEGGKVITDFAGNYDQPHAVTLQPDGKILLVGHTAWNECDSDFALARYNIDGTLDTSFGQGGRVVTDFFGGRDEALAVVIQSDGRIVVTGRAMGDHPNLALARYTPRGILDATFGKGGKVATPSDKFAFVSSISLRPDGGITVVGSSSTCFADERNPNAVSIVTFFALARYRTDGRLDTALANRGTAVTFLRDDAAMPTAIAIQPDGKFIMAGDTNIEGRPGYYVLHRFNEDGSPDDSFGRNSKVTTMFNRSTRPRAIGLLPDGSFIVAGSASGSATGSSKAVSLARYSKNGELDLNFGKEGKVTTPFDGYGEASAITIQRDGKIIAGGYSETGDLGDFLLMRCDKDGALDSEFGSNGIVYADFNGITDKSPALGLKRSLTSNAAQKADCTGRLKLSVEMVKVDPLLRPARTVDIPTGQPTGVPGPPSSSGPGSGSGGGRGGGMGSGTGSGTGGGMGGGSPSISGRTGDGPATSVDQRPVLLNNPRPRYTEEARKNKIQGTVVARVLISTDGSVKQVRITRGLPDGLDEMAIQAAYQMRFRPAMKSGQPVSFWQSVQIEFNL
jgi:TonB family protein